MITRFFNAQVLRAHQFMPGELWIDAGKIVSPQIAADRHVDLQGGHIAPGFIDMQINGAFGVDFTTQAENVEFVARELTRFGVSAFLPTVISTDPLQYRYILPLLQPRPVVQGARILGIHLEGPFINPEYAGAHEKACIMPGKFGLPHLQSCYGSLSGVKVITLAPELPGALAAIQSLRQLGIVAAAGHSKASYAQMQAAAAGGLRYITHLFNAMPPFHHRSPGIIGAALGGLADNPWFYSLIVDLQHLHAAAVQLAWKSHPLGCVLVSDGNAAMGRETGLVHPSAGQGYRLGNRQIELRDAGVFLAGTEIMAGSGGNLLAAVKALHALTGCSMAQALEAASLTPAKVLGIEAKKGHLHVGADADFNLWTPAFELVACYINGECVRMLGDDVISNLG